MEKEEDLSLLNGKGIFPAPGQSEGAFWNKVAHLSLETPLSFSLPASLQPFDIHPFWVQIVYDNTRLRLWEGAALWQEEVEEGFTLPKIQIARRVSPFYSPEELIAHEMIHAVRCDFSEGQFEEMLAFATSPRAWRRCLGPFFRTPQESSLFVGALVVTLVMQAVAFVTEWGPGWLLFPWLPALLITAGSFRLWRTRLLFRRCLRTLAQAADHPERQYAVALRMSDQEIRACAQMTPEEMREFVAREKHLSLRWSLLASCYFGKGQD